MTRHFSPNVQDIADSVYSGLAHRLATHQGEVFPLHVGDTWMEPPEGCRMEDLRVVDHPGPCHGRTAQMYEHRQKPTLGRKLLQVAVRTHPAVAPGVVERQHNVPRRPGPVGLRTKPVPPYLGGDRFEWDGAVGVRMQRTNLRGCT